MQPTSLDHVALWVEQREPLAGFLCEHLGMHEISRGDTFTLVGADAREGKLTLFDAEGPRERGVLERVVLRVSDLDAALWKLPPELEVELNGGGVAGFEAPQGLRLGLVERPACELDYDLDHVVLSVADTDRSAEALLGFGFERRDGLLSIEDRHLRLVNSGGGAVERPLLNHLALLVDSAEAVRVEAERRGFEIAAIKDAPNTIAVFVEGPDAVQLEYVEHKPGFALV